ncbi:MAG TPA: hypothetical protein VMU01_11170 [Rhizomicrobium sp.]|nr:hypothetical protein [Rhizomicrobium sp.]
MRMTLLLAAAAISAVPAFAARQTWIAACQGGQDTQYTQTLGGDGHLNIANGDGTYTTFPVKQAFNNGAIVCGTTGATGKSQIAEVCADTNRDALAVMSPGQMARHLRPQDATIYCSASVSIQ